MKRIVQVSKIGLILWVACVVASCCTTTGHRDAIISANDTFMATYKRGDAAGMADLYTVNGQLLPPNSDVIRGRAGIQTFWQGLMDAGIKEANLETVEVEGHCDTATEVGRFVVIGEGGQTLGNGKYIVLWKREGGEWRLHRDIWNSSVPPPSE